MENRLGLEVRHFITLRAVVDEGSFSAAARRLGYAQATVSHQIALLEQRVGHRVLERRSGPGSSPELTEAGAILLSHGQEILRHLALAEANVTALTDSSPPPLRVGFFQSVGSGFLPSVLRSLGGFDPAASIELIQESESETLMTMLSRGELDVALTDELAGESDIAFRPLFSDPWVLLSRRDQFGSKARIGLAALDGEAIMTFTERCSGVRKFERSLEASQLRPHIVVRSDDPALLEELVLAGRGSALLPRIALSRERHPSTSVYEIDSLPTRTIGLSFMSQRIASSSAARFAAAAEAAAARQRLQAVAV